MGSMLPGTLAVAAVLLTSATAATAQFRYEVVHGFAASGGGPSTPSAPLLETADGSLYGTTPSGGAGDAGVVFQLLPDRSIVTHDLGIATTGRNPYGGLVQTADGTFYGTTRGGGANASGIIFAMTASGTFITYDLPQVNDSRAMVPFSGPTTGLVVAGDGNLYAAVPGVTCCSPAFVRPGWIVRLTPQGVVTRLSVTAGVSSPRGPLVAGPGGYLYGTAKDFGVFPAFAFRFLPSSGQSETIHTFTATEGSQAVQTGLVLAPDGNLYGAAAGIPSIVFCMTPTGSVAVLHQFQGATEGMDPVAPLVVGSDGNLYGVTSRGGEFNAGTIFRISLTGAFDVLYSFKGASDGGAPLAALIQSRDGSLYGTASTGGPAGGGVVFRIKNVVSQPFLSIDFPGANASVGQFFEVRGWGLDHGAFTGTGMDAVHVYAWPNPGSGAAPIFIGAADYGIARADVGAVLGAAFTNAGYLTTAPYLTPGPYLIEAYGHSTVTGSFAVVASRTITVSGPASSPLMAMDTPGAGATIAGSITVTGWAIDAGAATGTGVAAVHVWAIPDDGSAPQFLGVATYGFSRPDLGAIFGSRFTDCGYSVTASPPAGSYTIAAFAWSTLTNSFNVRVLAANVAVQ